MCEYVQSMLHQQNFEVLHERPNIMHNASSNSIANKYTDIGENFKCEVYRLTLKRESEPWVLENNDHRICLAFLTTILVCIDNK